MRDKWPVAMFGFATSLGSRESEFCDRGNRADFVAGQEALNGIGTCENSTPDRTRALCFSRLTRSVPGRGSVSPPGYEIPNRVKGA